LIDAAKEAVAHRRRVANATETNPTRARFYPVVVRHLRAPTPNKIVTKNFLMLRVVGDVVTTGPGEG
jgi:hypothetical protein